MDQKIQKKKWTGKKIAQITGLFVVIAFMVYQLFISKNNSKLTIDKDKITISEVKKGEFQEYIIQFGEVVASNTFYLDAVEGGNIIQVFKESGNVVKKDEPIIALENANLRLSVLSQENALNEQINRVRTTRLQLDQNYLSQKQQLAQIENQLHTLKPKFTRDSTMFAKKLISKQSFEQTEADHKYNLKRLAFTFESFKTDSTARVIQLKQLRASELNMSENLVGVKKLLENLVIRAPIDGTLATSKLQKGQNVNKGERLGQVDEFSKQKLRVRVDELYIAKITKGLKASTTIEGEKYELAISHIYPTITNGQFEVDMEFQNDAPDNLRRGQSVKVKIELGNASKEILLPVGGGYYNKTGGNWIYVVDEGLNKAVKRNIKLGRKNANYYEILNGLEIGEKVITSSYNNFGDSEILVW
jgi:HlyD family secretion protein